MPAAHSRMLSHKESSLRSMSWPLRFHGPVHTAMHEHCIIGRMLGAAVALSATLLHLNTKTIQGKYSTICPVVTVGPVASHAQAQ